MKTSAQASDVPVKEAFVASTWYRALANTNLESSARLSLLHGRNVPIQVELSTIHNYTFIEVITLTPTTVHSYPKDW